MVAKIANARAKIIPATGHIFPIEDPKATVDSVHGFLKSNDVNYSQKETQ
jgi:hypothetical protein